MLTWSSQLVRPVYNSTTKTLGGLDTGLGTYQSIYGSPPLRSDHLVLNHRGYIFAQQSGIYTFAFTAVDETAYLWIGSAAYSGWRASNADIEVSYRVTGQGPGSGTFRINLNAGQYYPFRVVYAQAQGSGQLNLSFTAPDGTVFLSPVTTMGNPYVVRYACYGPFLAPGYVEPFGLET